MNYKVFYRTICLSWIILIACIIIKAFGGDWFEIDTSNTWLEEHEWASIAVCSLTSYVMFTFYYMAIAEVTHFKIWVHILLFPFFAGIAVLKIKFIPEAYLSLLDLFLGIGVPALLIWFVSPKPKKGCITRMTRVLVAFALNCGFQSISVMVRGFPTSVVVSSMIGQLIMSLDVLIMLVLYWLYSLYYKLKGGEEK